MPAELPHPALPGFAFSTPRRIRHSAAGWLLALLLGLLSGAATTALAQTPAAPPECAADEKFANTWYFGYRAGLDFNQATDSIPPKVLTDGAMEAPAGAGVMSDSNGKILFYSNGETVWNGDGTVMTNGTGLAGNRLTTDGPLPIRMPGTVLPGQPTRYLLFTLNSTVGLSYSEIDIPAGGGAGTLIAATKNTPLARGTAEKLTGVFHKNGCDIWVITHGWGAAKTGRNNRGDAFLAYRVRLTTGVDTIPIISPVGSLHAPSVSPVGYRGQLKVTPDGQRLALARYSEVLGDSSSTVELFGFDTGTGQVSANPRVPYVVDKGEGKYYGVEFSAGSYLYATVLNPPQLLQFDISGQGPVTRQVIPLKQTTPADLGSLQAAPDGKIYVARDNQPALGFIAYPDSLGAKARYADDSLQLGGRLSGRGLVNFNQSSLLRVGPGAEITGCRQISFTSPQIDFDGKTYAWTFGDGATSTEANPVHIYATPGDYTITLRITTACFCRQSSGSIRVPNLPEPGSIAGPQVLCAGTAPTILASTAAGSSDAGLPLLYQWEASPDNVTFSAIGGATGPSYLPANLPVGTTYFRRRAQLLLPNGSGPYCTPRFTTAVAITVVPALGAGAIAASQTVCVGAAAAPLTSTAAATGGTGTLAYQWEASADNVTFAPIGGATGDTYAPGVLASTTYFRRRVASGPCGPLYSNVVAVTVQPVVAPGAIAGNQTLCAGTTPSPLTSVSPAGGTAGIGYQWQQSADNATWQDINGATGETYAPGALGATTYFRRRASASGACALAYSNVVTINVVPALGAGAIAADQTICAGSSPAAFTSTAAATGGSGGLAYQWQLSVDNATWTDIPGATGETHANGPLTTTTYFRRRVASGPCGPLYSNVVAVTVQPAVVAGAIAGNQTLCAGTTPSPFINITPASGGANGFAYQWQQSADNATWSDIGGATGETYAPGALSSTTYFRRQASAGGACGPVYTNVVTVNVLPALGAGAIAADQTLCPGTAAAVLTSTAAATGGTGTLAYQWEASADNLTFAPIGGATGDTYAPGVLASTTYFRRRVSSGPCGPLYSNVVTISVLPVLSAGTIAADQTICAGSTPSPLTSTLGASGGAGSYAYQWEASTDNNTFTTIGGAIGATYAPGTLTATTYYRRRVTSGTGSCAGGMSNVVAITVQPLLVPTVSLPTPPVQCAGTALTFAATTTNVGAAPTFRWLVNGAAVATGPTFTSSTLATGDQVQVEVTPTAGLCTTGPVAATVTVTRTPIRQPTLNISLQPAAPVCPGEPITFSIAVATDTGPSPQYQWQVNGADVAGATGPVFTSTTLRAGQTVTLRLRTTDACGQPAAATSNGVVVRLLPPVVLSAGPDKEILLGSSVVLEGSADGNYPVTWTPALGLTIPPSDPLHPVAAPTVTTTYTLSGGTGGCASSDEVTVTVRPGIRIPNAFTPNGDGRDDTWQIEFIEQYPDNTVSVFNRWGNRVFSTQNYSRANEWHGDINGQPAPTGTYYYVVTTRGPLGRSYSGSLTILY